MDESNFCQSFENSGEFWNFTFKCQCETNHSQKAWKIRLYVESVLQNQFEHIK